MKESSEFFSLTMFTPSKPIKEQYHEEFVEDTEPNGEERLFAEHSEYRVTSSQGNYHQLVTPLVK